MTDTMPSAQAPLTAAESVAATTSKPVKAKAPEPQAPAMPKPNPAVDTMRTIAHNYHVPFSEQTLHDIAGTSGDTSDDTLKSFEEHVKTVAQGLYPTLAPQIKAGIPTAYLLDPYRQVGKRVLGEHFEPDFIGDSRHAMALSGGVEPQTGRPAPMGLNEWTHYLKSEPTFGWIKTPDGQRNLKQVVDAINEGFGGNQ